jgi:methylmalonyl-CoA mutase N-terminal domain/subunit
MMQNLWQHWASILRGGRDLLSAIEMENGSKRRVMIYTPLSNPDFDCLADLGNPGEEPFTRGIHSNMYRSREFTMRQLTGFGSPEDTNKRIKFMLEHGATGLNILFDLPTIQMYDSDHPFSAGQVGMSGVCVDSVEDEAINP